MSYDYLTLIFTIPIQFEYSNNNNHYPMNRLQHFQMKKQQSSRYKKGTIHRRIDGSGQCGNKKPVML